MKTNTVLASLLSLCGLAQAGIFSYSASLDGPSEAPPNASPGTGWGTAVYDSTAQTLTVAFSFSDLVGTTTAMHIHAATLSPFTGTAGVATPTPSFPASPLGVTAGSYGPVLFHLTLASSYNAAFVTANGGTPASAEAALAAALASGKAYLNIHTTAFPGGEIRGFFVPVPEPETAALAVAGCLGAFALRRRLLQGQSH